jgi:aminopeptidase
MKDARHERLVEVLVGHSTQVKAGERVLIEAYDIPHEFTTVLIRKVAEAGGVPFVQTYQEPVRRALLHAGTEAYWDAQAEFDLQRMRAMDCYIGVRGSHNLVEFSDVPPEKMNLWEKRFMHPVHLEQRVKRTRWVVLRWPHPSMAQAAGMPTEAFEDFYFKVCAGVDYGAMERASQPLAELMRRTDRVRIAGPGTELRFSIKGIGARASFGLRNVPDGECFSCPVRDSVEGHVQYNCESLYRGTIFNGIRLAFRAGRIVEATADSAENTRKLNQILDGDEGARFIGEFALAFNPFILRPMKDVLFDEKIAGSFHFTPGQAYEDVDNGNRSQVHWDMVCIQRPEYGGGEIEFDGRVIRRDGMFVVDELKGLNPDRLGA